MTTHAIVHIHDAAEAVAARTAAREAAERAGFDETDAHRAGLVATELATNLGKHAKGGEILVGNLTGGEIEIIAVDRGPGITDITRSMSDGHSTAGTPGTGLGAIRRLSDEFDVYSSAPHGTVVWARLWQARTPPKARASFDIAGISISKQGEPVCGDAWTVLYRPDEVSTAIIDGLGHGLYAAEASRAAVEALHSRPFLSCDDAVRTIHARLRHTRGAAGTVVSISRVDRTVRVAGIGNVAAAVCNDGHIRHAVVLSGILGGEARTVREYSYPWPADAVLVMHSDGLATSWSLASYPGLQQRRPAVIASLLYRDFSRGRDDVTVVVGREAA